MEYTVPTPMTVLEALRKLYPDSSRRTLQTWLKNGRFTADGVKIFKENEPLAEGQKLTSKETFEAPKIPGLRILYEDRYMVVIDKPEGLLSVPLDEGGTHRHALGLLREYYDTDQILAVHRIDRETSGVLLFARGKVSEDRFKAMFEKHDLKREYFAILEGRLKSDEGKWESQLLELPSLRVVESDEGKHAITHYKVMRRSAKYTYVLLELETGRKHQIRVQCQMAGHPVVGDKKYGAIENPLQRLGLHALSLSFKHPFTEKTLSFTSQLPRVFQVLGGKI